ncbi:MAG: SUMF1/EgtB/PvdO family nonheme iron enzyme [Magnetococcales bacterium]|nr:SUMF1/EgtB/PvdO family nonheme iron enzyme [Magnetococcales bacterium]
MARVKPPEGQRSAVSVFFSRLELGKSLIFGLIFMAAATIGWGVMSFVQESKKQTAWQSCLIEQRDGALYPQMEEIPAGIYHLSGSLIGDGDNRQLTAAIQSPFLIQSEEVTRLQFRKYVDYVNTLPAGKEKDRLLVRLGVQWKKGGTSHQSVNAISWEGAWDYAHWLALKTGCSYDIPSQSEWIATISYLQSRDQVQLDGSAPLSGPLKNLLWGVREWSRSRCSSGYYLLGRDDLTSGFSENQSICMPAMFSIAGFRVVLNLVAAQNVNQN